VDSLERKVPRLQRFVADESNDFHTPVAVIRNKTSIALLQPQTWQDYATVLQEINTETERLEHLISYLLALAHGDEGKAPFEQETIRLDLLTQATAHSARFLAEERNIQLTVQAEQPVTLIGDEARLIQVVLNLVENALRYTNPGGNVLVTVEAREQVARLVQSESAQAVFRDARRTQLAGRSSPFMMRGPASSSWRRSSAWSGAGHTNSSRARSK